MIVTSTFEGHEAVENAINGRCQTPPVVCVTALTNGFGRRRIRVNDIGQFAKPHPAVHRHGDLADHIAGMVADNRGT